MGNVSGGHPRSFTVFQANDDRFVRFVRLLYINMSSLYVGIIDWNIYGAQTRPFFAHKILQRYLEYEEVCLLCCQKDAGHIATGGSVLDLQLTDRSKMCHVVSSISTC